MFIECITICVNDSDFLAWTLPTNKSMFDNMIVVTTHEDILTQKLCEHWHVNCVKTNVCYDNTACFNKAKMINIGLSNLTNKGWIVHIDADIFLTPKFRAIIENLKNDLDESFIYSIDRMNCKSFKEWIKFWVEPEIINENNIFVHARPFEMATRLARFDGGWSPIGYFQMWHSSKNKKYPEEHNTAARTDLQFGESWPRKQRALIPELYCIHLETNFDKMGANWNGRTTPKFGEEILGNIKVKKEIDDEHYNGWDL